MNLQYFILLLVASLTLIIALIVFFNNPRIALNRTFMLVSLFVAGWSIANLNFSSLNDPAATTFWAYTAYCLGSGTLTAFLDFVWISTSPPNSRSYKQKQQLLWLAWSGLSVSVLLLAYWHPAGFSLNNPQYIRQHPAFALFGLYPTLVFILAEYRLFQQMQHNIGSYKRQLMLMFFSSFLAIYIGFYTNLLLPLTGNYHYLWLGPFLSLVFVIFTLYALLIAHLFDIRIVVRRAIVYTGLVAFVFTVYSALIFFLTQIAQQGSVHWHTFLLNILGALIIGLSFEPIRLRTQKYVNHLIFRKEQQQEEVLHELSNELARVDSLDEVLELVMQKAVKMLDLKHSAVFVFQQDENNSLAIKSIREYGYPHPESLVLDERDFVISYFQDNHRITLTSSLEEEINKPAHYKKESPPEQLSSYIRNQAIKRTVVKKLEKLVVAATVPLAIDNRLLGLLMLSPKTNGLSYSPAEIKLLEILGNYAITAIEKARLTEGEQVKTEFVSITSHELLTPITAIEGYLSMILDENLGHTDAETRTYLTKVYELARRLSMLVKDLLLVSRIEASRLKVEPQALDLNKLIPHSISQLKYMAKELNVQVGFKPSNEKSNPNPTSRCLVWADPDRTSDIFLNLISNAIKYSPNGHVSISIANQASKLEPTVYVQIKDNGIGMSKEQQAHLFQKFYRAETPQTKEIIGTGLGLYIVKATLEAMGGSIEVHSRLGKGTTFTFSLPLFQVQQTEIA